MFPNPWDEGASKVRSLRKLARAYFKDVTVRVLDPYLKGQGFRRPPTWRDRVCYRRGHCLIEVGYAPHTTDMTPRFALVVAVGMHQGRFRRPRLIGFWQVPAPDRGGKRWQWEFRGPEQLKARLTKVIALFEAYAHSLWEDEQRLREVLDKEEPIYRELANP